MRNPSPFRSLKPHLLGVVNGRPIWQIMGAADDDGTDDGTGTDDDGDGTEGDGSNDDDVEDDKSSDTISRAEYERLTLRMKNADRRATAAENKVREFENKDKTELEKIKEERDEAIKARDEAHESLTKARMENAFFAHSKVTWHDPQDAFRLADLREVTIEDDGTVVGMEAAVKALAKAKPHLVKSDSVTPATEATGSQHNGKRKGSDDDAAAADRKKRFPSVYGRQ